MKQIMIFVGICVTVASYTLLVDDPLNSLFSFILAGSIPGTEIVLGFWPTLISATLLLLLVRNYLRYLKISSMEITAKQIRQEKLRTNFKESNSTISAKERSVIAAPSS